MGTDQGNWAGAVEEDCSPAEQQIVEGWCINCICQHFYHLGDDAGVCIECNCAEFAQDSNSDLLDRLKGTILPEPSEEVGEEIYVAEIVEEGDHKDAGDQKFIEVIKIGIFIGKTSRGCENCGTIKLYKEFNDSKNPVVLCKYCAWENTELAMLESMTDKERLEIAEMEDSILENEMAYDEAIERQEMIDDVLRGLDE